MNSEPYRPPVTPPHQPAPEMTSFPAPQARIDTSLPPYAGPPPQYMQYPPAPPKKKGMPAWAIVLIVLGSVVVLFCGGGAILFAIGAGSAGSGPKPTVHVQACTWDGFATYATYTLTNNDKKPHDYYVEGTVGHSPALPDILKNVAPGETASGKLMGTEQGDCHITSVDQQ